MTEQNTSKPEPSIPALGPGDRLQSARISRGLTVEDVANKMHLSESILSSLEDNDFEDITAPIFVKGYLRAYARIVNVDENDIIQQYSSFYTDGDPPISSTSNTSPEINADDARVRWTTWLVILGLIVLLSVWWWNRYQQPAQPLSLDSTEQPADLAQSSQTDSRLPIDMVSGKSSVDKPDEALSAQVQADLAAMAAQQKEEKPLEPPQPVETDMQPAVEPATEAMQPRIEDTPQAETVESVVAEEQTETSEQAVTNTNTNTNTSPEAVMADEGLVITVNADTWTDIRDADGNKLIYDLLRTGEKISVSGKTPMRAFLGNGYGVSMKYQGKEIDLSNSIRADNTARVRIGR